ncbi:MAG TPA: ATP-binding protein [bacterium]
MNLRKNFSLTSEIMISLGLLMVVAVALIGIISLGVFDAMVKKGLPSTADFMAKTIMNSLNRAVAKENFSLAAVILDAGYYINIRDIAIVDQNLRNIAGKYDIMNESEKQKAKDALESKSLIKYETGKEFYYYLPVVKENAPLGVVRLKILTDPATRQQELYKKLLIMYILLDSGIILIFGVYLLRRRIVKPLQSLIAYTGRIAEGNYSERIAPSGGQEVADLAASFNVMAESLSRKEKQLNEKIEELERANRDLSAARQEIIQAEKLATVGSMASGIAHELGNPISSIAGYLELLGKKNYGEKETDYIERMKKDLLRMDGIIREMLDFARPKKPSFRRISISESIEQTIGIVKPQQGFDRIKIEKIQETDNDDILGDMSQLKQVWINLFINSRDAMPDGGTILIRIRDDMSPNRVRVEFSDTGFGIKPEDIGKIFEPFFSTKGIGKGTGLGLTVVQRIVFSMNGKIAVDSVPGNGAKFNLSFPR